MRNLLILVAVPVLIAGALAYPAWLWYGDQALLHCGVALGLCLIPAIATMIAIDQLAAKSPEGRLFGMLGSSGVRMAVCLGTGVLLYKQLPETFPAVFLYWLLLFYLVILGLEVGLLVRQKPTDSDPANPPRTSS